MSKRRHSCTVLIADAISGVETEAAVSTGNEACHFAATTTAARASHCPIACQRNARSPRPSPNCTRMARFNGTDAVIDTSTTSTAARHSFAIVIGMPSRRCHGTMNADRKIVTSSHPATCSKACRASRRIVVISPFAPRPCAAATRFIAPLPMPKSRKPADATSATSVAHAPKPAAPRVVSTKGTDRNRCAAAEALAMNDHELACAMRRPRSPMEIQRNADEKRLIQKGSMQPLTTLIIGSPRIAACRPARLR